MPFIWALYRDIYFLTLKFNEFSAFLANPSSGLPLDVRVGRFSQTTLIDGPGVAHEFRQARVASNCPDLVCRASSLG